jgi:hypothetical protein
MTRAADAKLIAALKENAELRARLALARLPETAPPGWLTIAEFAEQWGLSLPGAYRRAERGRVILARYAPSVYDRRLVTYIDPATAAPRRKYKRAG